MKREARRREEETMESRDVMAALHDLSELKVTRNTTEADATAAVRPLGALNGCLLGVTRFSGLTPWEHHPDADELLYVVEGAIEVTVLTATDISWEADPRVAND
jgi:mannose-6-phosphate isomerase-like protein (cupin superfamily)